MQIRYAQRSELEAAAVLLNVCWRWAYRDFIDAAYLASISDNDRHERLLAHYENGRLPLLLFNDTGVLLGFCGFGASMTPGYPDDGEISAIYLREDAVGKGYGHALFVCAEGELRRQGYRSLVLDVLSANQHAIAFYAAHGYAKAGDRKYTWGGKEYALDIMRKAVL